MIQRIQTIWMSLAVLGAVFLFISGQDVDIFQQFSIVPVFCVLLVLLGGFSIFSYRNRKKQLVLNNISIVINALLISVLVYWLLNLPGGIDFPEKGIEPLFPLISIVSIFIANIYIKRDERLVKSVDRLR